MPDSNLCFSEVTVRRLYGQDYYFSVSSLCKGVNVIAGPNASGKTTLGRAMEAVLWPKEAAGDGPELEASFVHDGASCFAKLNGSKCAYQKNGADSERPVRIAPSHRDRYHLYLHELLTLTEDDAFAEAILQEAAGGYDLHQARTELGFEVHERRGGSRAKHAKEAREALEEAKARNDEVQEKKRSLDQLYRRRDDAHAAKRAAEALQEALTLREARRKIEEAKIRLAAYPDRLEHVQADDAERLRSLSDEVAEAEAEIQVARDEKQAADQAIEGDELPEDGVSQKTLDELEERVGKLDEYERTVQREKKALAEARAKARSAWQGDDLGLKEQEAESLDLPALSNLRKAVKNVNRFRAQLETRRFLKEIASATSEAHDASALKNGMDALAEWQQAASGRGDAHGWRIGGAVLGIALLATGTAGFVLAPAGPAWPFVALIAGGVFVAIGAWFAASNSSGQPRKASNAQKRYDALGLSPPESWSEEAVQLQSETLRGDLVNAEVGQAMHEAWKRWEKSWEGVEEKLDEAQDALHEEARGFGLDGSVVEEEDFLWVVDRLQRWQEAQLAVKEAEAGLRTAEDEKSEALGAFNELLASCDQQQVSDPAAANGAISAITKAVQRRREAEHTKQTAEKQISSARTKKERSERKRAEILDRLDLSENKENEVASLVEKRSGYQSAQDEKSAAEAEYETVLERLKSLPGYEDDMPEMSDGEIRERLEDAQEKASELDDISDQITRINQLVEQAREGHEIEKRYAEYRSALDDLSSKRERDYGNAVGAALADFVQEKTHDQDLPAVFTRAKKLFTRITKGDYRLHIDRKNKSFRAITKNGRGMGLNELSSGTKVQLLLAVRVAFIETQEQVCKLPLILDELLANSDDEKADAIIDALKTISREGRQIVYLTAQADEVRKWEQAMQGDELPLSVITLGDADLRERPGAGDGAMLPARPAAPAVEGPHEVTYEAYRDLAGVPRWIPRQPIGALHLWYLVEDVSTLHELLNLGLTTWGALQNVVEVAGIANAPITGSQYQEIKAKAKAVEAWRDAWHVGRGELVRRATLEEADAVSATFIDDVAALAQRLNGDGERIIEALRNKQVARFRSNKTEELETYFLREGYIDRAEMLSPEEMWRRVIAETTNALEEGVVEPGDLQRTIDRFA